MELVSLFVCLCAAVAIVSFIGAGHGKRIAALGTFARDRRGKFIPKGDSAWEGRVDFPDANPPRHLGYRQSLKGRAFRCVTEVGCSLQLLDTGGLVLEANGEVAILGINPLARHRNLRTEDAAFDARFGVRSPCPRKAANFLDNEVRTALMKVSTAFPRTGIDVSVGRHFVLLRLHDAVADPELLGQLFDLAQTIFALTLARIPAPPIAALEPTKAETGRVKDDPVDDDEDDEKPENPPLERSPGKVLRVAFKPPKPKKPWVRESFDAQPGPPVRPHKQVSRHCLLCGETIREDPVRCADCDGPHHGECWAYSGRCADAKCGCTGKKSS